MGRLSAVIIAYNEEHAIVRCLKSLQPVVDEIIVVDSGSSDCTADISRSLGAKVITCTWHGYAQNKNLGNAHASSDFILWLDADEMLSDELADSIAAVKNHLSGAYSVNRMNNYCGKWIRHGGFYPDKKIRIFNRKQAFWSGGSVHETLQFTEPVRVTQLKGDILHFSYTTVQEHWKRMQLYSSLAARDIAGRSVGFKIGKMLFSPVFRFTRSFFFQAGFLDGSHGFLLAAITSIEVFEKYRKSLLHF
ncbi:MAG: beta 1,4 glucosyltransferase [Chitinophagales bacterium]|nr:MAG: beta 1,4 glucosyltransferase [Chitinophagales bacterium]